MCVFIPSLSVCAEEGNEARARWSDVRMDGDKGIELLIVRDGSSSDGDCER
jgi:hypothetical protein